MTEAIYLNELGLVNALGSDKESILSGLRKGISSGMKKNTSLLDTGTTYIGQVEMDLPLIPRELKAYDCRNNRLLLAALNQIKTVLSETVERYGADRVGVVIGTSTSGIAEGEVFIESECQKEDYYYRQQEIGAPAVFVSEYLQLDGPCLTVSTACSSSAKALATARNWLSSDLCDAVIVGGCDSLCRLTVNGFQSLGLVSESVCLPFQVSRDGINIGEAAAVFLVTREKSALRLAAAGESSDAHHISAPHPEGEGAERAILAALQEAGLQADDIDYVNLHGTATPANDLAESKAIKRIFNHVACSSTKPLTGHTLGAAGATELALCWLLMSESDSRLHLPEQIMMESYDDGLPDIGLLTEESDVGSKHYWRMLSNSFAFGGSNMSLIIEKDNTFEAGS